MKSPTPAPERGGGVWPHSRLGRWHFVLARCSVAGGRCSAGAPYLAGRAPCPAGGARQDGRSARRDSIALEQLLPQSKASAEGPCRGGRRCLWCAQALDRGHLWSTFQVGLPAATSSRAPKYCILCFCGTGCGDSCVLLHSSKVKV